MIISYCIELQESILKRKTSYRNLLQEHYRRCIERDNSKAAKDVVGASVVASGSEVLINLTLLLQVRKENLISFMAAIMRQTSILSVSLQEELLRLKKTRVIM